MGKQAIKEESLTVSVDRAAVILGVNYHTIWSGVKSGEIPAIRFGRAIRISKKWIEKKLMEGEQPTS
jgi:excisionase family DNA binding protein